MHVVPEHLSGVTVLTSVSPASVSPLTVLSVTGSFKPSLFICEQYTGKSLFKLNG